MPDSLAEMEVPEGLKSVYFDEFVEGSPQPVLLFSALGIVQFANQASMPILLAMGTERGEVLSGKWLKLIEEVSTTGMAHAEFLDEVGLCFEVVLSPCTSPSTTIKALCRDVTRERELEAELADHNLKATQKDTILAMVATYNHEINNPLTIAMSLLQRPFQKLTPEILVKVNGALDRVATVTKKLKNASEESIGLTQYTGDAAMVDLSKVTEKPEEETE